MLEEFIFFIFFIFVICLFLFLFCHKHVTIPKVLDLQRLNYLTEKKVTILTKHYSE